MANKGNRRAKIVGTDIEIDITEKKDIVIESHDDHHHGPAKGLTRWLFTTNHKDIGTLYLWFSFAMFLIGGAMALVIRAELFQPGMQIVEPEFYNQMLTLLSLIHI